MNITFISPSLAIGGIGKMTSTLALASYDAGNSTNVITLYGVTESDLTYKHKSLEMDPVSGLLQKIWLTLKRTIEIRKQMQVLDSEVVLCLDPISFLGVLFFKLTSRISLRIGVGCFTPLELLTSIDKIIIKVFFKYSDAIYLPSLKFKKDFDRNFPMCSIISHRIHCPISSDALACVLNERDNLPVADFQFLGRLSPEKSPETFMKIAQRNPEFIFRMSGDGQERKSLEKYRDVHCIENIYINGFELPSKVLPRGKVLIIPSKYETFGMVIPEAWLHGMQVIGSKYADGPQELILKYGHGQLADFEDSLTTDEQIEIALSQINDTEFERLILDTFSPFTVLQEWLHILGKSHSEEIRN